MVALADQGNSDLQMQTFAYKMYGVYPQLVPYSNVKVKMQLNVSGNSSPETTAIVKSLQHSNITWVEDADANTLQASITFGNATDSKWASIEVKNADGKIMVPQITITYETALDAKMVLPLSLFGIGIYNPIS
jgi:hypothetical protein